jgi:hypothetical protein
MDKHLHNSENRTGVPPQERSGTISKTSDRESDPSAHTPVIRNSDTSKPVPEKTTDERVSERIADELISDGSASAFEGTEAIDSHDEDLAIEKKNHQPANDPSGRSYY